MNIINEIKKLSNLYNLGKLNLNKLKNEINKLYKNYERNNYDYLNSLLYPEISNDIRIPNSTTPSCTFQLNSTQILTTNDKGCILIKCNPVMLANENIIGKCIRFKTRFPQGSTWFKGYFTTYFSKYLSTCWYYNENDLDGFTRLTSTGNNTFSVLNLGQTLPSNIYERYRLVSACLKLRYIGPIDEASGIMGSSILFDESQDIGCQLYMNEYIAPESSAEPAIGPYRPDTATTSGAKNMLKYSVFEEFRDAYYHCENNCLEGIRMLYFPIDNSYEDFLPLISEKSNYNFNYNAKSYIGGQFAVPVKPYFTIDNSDEYKTGFNWIAYCQNLPANKPCLRLEFVGNYECIPSSAFLNYCPNSINRQSLNSFERKRIYDIVKSNAIQKLNK